MRIIGGRDYYDGAGYGVDPTITFVRKQQVVDNPPSRLIAWREQYTNEQLEQIPDLFPNYIRHKIATPPRATLSGISVEHTRTSLTVDVFTVVVAGEATVGMRATVDYNKADDIQYDIIPLKNWHSNTWEWRKRKFSISDHDRQIIREWAIDNKIVTAVTICEENDRRALPVCKINGSFLKDYHYYELEHPAETHMKISNWVGGVLPFSGNPTVEISDISKIKKAGFDTKISFRRQKAG